MEDSHGKDISLQYTTVKGPGMNPRGSKIVPGTGGGNSEHLTGDMHGLNLANRGLVPMSITGRKSIGAPIITLKDRVCSLKLL